MKPSPRARICAPDQLTDQELRQLWELRLELIDLKPEVAPEQDWEKFLRTVRGCSLVIRMWDGPALLGFYVLFQFDGVVQGHRYRWLGTEYGFIRPAWRRHPWIALQYLRVMAHCWSRRPGVRHYIGGIGYPTGAMSLTSIQPRLLLWGDEGLTPMEEQIFARMLELFAPKGMTPQGVWMPTLPSALHPRWLKRHGASPELARFLERSPHWEQGYGWPTLVKGSPLHLLQNILQRAQRHLPRPRRAG